MVIFENLIARLADDYDTTEQHPNDWVSFLARASNVGNFSDNGTSFNLILSKFPGWIPLGGG
jgi:hypothetical protein